MDPQIIAMLVFFGFMMWVFAVNDGNRGGK